MKEEPRPDIRLINGECVSRMANMPDAYVHAVVTDPPYGLSFMGKGWDAGAPGAECWAEALRVAAPGAHLLCFGGTRTFHRLACSIEDSGWEIRDCVMWVYGSGMPKSMDVGRRLEKAGDPRAAEWAGWGTCLKPAWEPIVVARKPLAGTVAENVLEHGTGAINVDGCRTPPTSEGRGGTRDGQSSARRRYGDRGSTSFGCLPGPRGGDPRGRFPANLAHDGSSEVIQLFPESAGQQAPLRGTEPSRTGAHGIYGRFQGGRPPCEPRGDGGSAARFFYCAKASRSERGEGNDHPTVKPVALMEWLVRMVTREGQLVLDPFAGSGSTLVACGNLGRRCIGIENDPHYCEIIKTRLERAGHLWESPSG